MSWKLREGVSWTHTEYGGVLLDRVSGEFWQLNPTGAMVLSEVLAGRDLDATVLALADAFAVDAGSDTVSEDATAIIEQLAGADLVVRA
jgi:hypothetical protein